MKENLERYFRKAGNDDKILPRQTHAVLQNMASSLGYCFLPSWNALGITENRKKE